LILSSPKVTRLQMADQQVRAVIKDILHLHPSTTDHVPYARKRDGVMGIPIGPACPLGQSQVGVSSAGEWGRCCSGS
jgi:hypothetical protein